MMAKRHKPTFVSAFAGMGGFDLAFTRRGAKCLAQVECDPQCLSVLRRHFPKTRRFKDIREFNRASIAVRPDIIVGGFPCQDLSVAGRRAGLSGERSGLFFEFMRVVAEFAPDSVLIENVPGLLSGCGCPLCGVVAGRLREHLEREREVNKMARDCGCGECRVGRELHKAHSGRNFAIVLSALAKLGYGVAMRILDAQWFGVAQRRERVFIVGCLGNVRRACEILFERDSLPWASAPSREARTRVAASLTRGSAAGSGVNAHGRRREDDVNLVPMAFGGNNTQGAIDVATACNAHGGTGRIDFESETFICGPLQSHSQEHGHAMTTQQAVESGHAIAHTLRAEGHDASEDGTGRGVLLVPVAFTELGQGHHSYQETELASSLRTGGSAMANVVAAPVAFQCKYFADRSEQGGKPGEVSPTITSAQAERSDGEITVAYRTSGNCGVMEQGDRAAALTTNTDPNSQIVFQCQGSNVGPLGTIKGHNHTAGVPFVNERMAVRRLMPVECERLQGFPDGWSASGIVKGEQVELSDSARYRMLGNAVAVPNVEWIARRMVEQLVPSSSPV